MLGASNGTLKIGASKTGSPATVWQVTYDPRVRNVAIRAGENSGRTLPHRNIVTDLRALGTWNGSAMSLALASSPNPALRQAVFLQRGKGGPIVSALKL